ncbi:hypothetical protein SARC_02226 [Sphaeroforma arctica JP610]|uniref:Uncharacterized protein n=1 Tax=Sphaeroforma arctica JP610 TaxID=667725 RepID=A0A0L0G9E3_9EUKA|nr:hypothetical protein SARC_02226 [Sphaeroforma arctica JP610]KNC85605.1 hypothetical protein SARC_02226 [Sphaeroforma arctica JP610]|eukprot:XP_014159507.1 hypothetical protein SARC_02226 [Sphaeroforma arctica JP610]
MVATKSLLCFIVGSMAWVNTYAQPRGEQSLCRAFVEENCECSTATSREERSSCVLECITGNVDEENVCAKMVERMEAREKCHAFIEQECSNCTSGDHRAEHTCVRTCLEENDSEGLCEMRGMGKGRKNRNMTMDDLEMVDVEQHGPNGPMGDHKPSEKCRAFVEENCECEIAIDIEGTKEGDAKEHAEKDVQKHTGGSDEGHRQPVPHGADGGPRKGGEVSECVHECIESLDTDGVCKREGKNGKHDRG